MSPRIKAEVTFAIVPDWLLRSTVSDKAVRLYGVLWRHADRDYRAHPSRQRLAALMRCSKDSVDRAIRELVQVGALSVTRRSSAQGNSSNDYTLHVQPFEQLSLAGVAAPMRPGGRTDAEDPSRTHAAQNESKDLNERIRARAQGAEKPNPLFDQFWSIYPARHGRKIGKGEARLRWAKLSSDDQHLAIKAARNLAAAVAREETLAPDAFRWLRDRRFEDWAQPVATSRRGLAAAQNIARCSHGYPVIEDEDGLSSGCFACDPVELERAWNDHRKAAG